MRTSLLVLSDLDGTFLDHDTYSFEGSLSALKELILNSGSIAFITSKTSAEVLELIRGLKVSGVTAPISFAVENGCGIYLPKEKNNLEDIKKINPDLDITERDDYFVISFGSADYQELRLVIKEIEAETAKKVIGFGDMTSEELAQNSGLSVTQAKLAKIREFDEPYYIEGGSDQDYLKANELTESRGLSYHKGGRYAHVSLPQDKGRAAKLLIKLESIKHQVETIGIGDAENDLPFLQVCDRGYLVRGKKEITLELSPNIKKVEAVGPAGFSEVVRKELANLSS